MILSDKDIDPGHHEYPNRTFHGTLQLVEICHEPHGCCWKESALLEESAFQVAAGFPGSRGRTGFQLAGFASLALRWPLIRVGYHPDNPWVQKVPSLPHAFEVAVDHYRRLVAMGLDYPHVV